MPETTIRRQAPAPATAGELTREQSRALVDVAVAMSEGSEGNSLRTESDDEDNAGDQGGGGGGGGQAEAKADGGWLRHLPRPARSFFPFFLSYQDHHMFFPLLRWDWPFLCTRITTCCCSLSQAMMSWLPQYVACRRFPYHTIVVPRQMIV